jgi:hypothetical protein
MFNFPRSDLANKVAALASSGTYVGTSSWKYEGWLGLIYTPERYQTRGKLSHAKFETTCLAEYAETFKTVCADAGYYLRSFHVYHSVLPAPAALGVVMAKGLDAPDKVYPTASESNKNPTVVMFAMPGRCKAFFCPNQGWTGLARLISEQIWLPCHERVTQELMDRALAGARVSPEFLPTLLPLL